MVVVLFSGGVDSTFLVFLLKKLCISCVCVYIKVCLFNSDVWLREFETCLSLSQVLNCKLMLIDFSNVYYKYIFSRALAAYKFGFTPNIDVLCNSKLKFNYLISYFNGLFVLTTVYFFFGHYVRKTCAGIYLSVDLFKDQSYFLGGVLRFGRCFFLLGWFYKYEVVCLVQFLNLSVNASSRGVCFLNLCNFGRFIAKYCSRCMRVVDTTYKCLGFTDASYLTIGQRLGISPFNFYVFRKHISTIRVAVSYSRYMFTKHIKVKKCNILHSIFFPLVYVCKVNSGSRLLKCFIYVVSTGFRIHFIYPVRVLASGQLIVVYLRGRFIASFEII